MNRVHRDAYTVLLGIAVLAGAIALMLVIVNPMR